MMFHGKPALNRNAQFSQIASLVAILMTVFSNVSANLEQSMKTVPVRLILKPSFFYKKHIEFSQIAHMVVHVTTMIANKASISVRT